MLGVKKLKTAIIVGIVAATCLLFLTAFGFGGGYDAEAAEDYAVTITVGSGEETNKSTLAEAVAAANEAEENVTIKLYKDFDSNEITESLVFTGKRVTLDLNGHTVDRGLTEATENGYVIGIDGENAEVTLTDTSETKSGKISGGYNNGSGNVGGGGVYVKKGSFILENGSISENKALQGGGIYVASGAKLTVTGGSVSNNEAEGLTGYGNQYYEGQGGAIYALGEVIMSGGEIRGNKAELFGGVYVFAATSTATDGVFTLTGGTLNNNTMTYMGDFAKNSIYYISDQDSHISIDDTNRNANVWLSGTLILGGSPVLTADGADAAVQILHQTTAANRQSKIIDNGYKGNTVTATFAYKDNDGNNNKTFADIVKVYAGEGVSIDKSKWNFTGLQEGKAFGFDTNGNLVTGDGVYVDYDTDGAEGTPKNAYYIPNETFSAPDGEGLTKTGYNLVCWTYGGKIYYPEDVITVGSEPMTFKAVWRSVNKTYKYTIANSDDGYKLTDGDDVIGLEGMSLDVLLNCLLSDRATEDGYAECEINFDNVNLGESTFTFTNGKYTINGALSSTSEYTLAVESGATVTSYADVKNTADYKKAVALNGGLLTVEDGTIESNGDVICEKGDKTSELIVNGGTITGSAESKYSSVAINGVVKVTINGGVVRATGNSTAISVINDKKIASLTITGGSVISPARNAIVVMYKDKVILSGTPTLQSGEGYADISKPVSETGFEPIKDNGYKGETVTINVYSNNQKSNGYNYDYSGTVMISPNDGITIEDGKWSLFSDIYSLTKNADGAYAVTAVKCYNYLIQNNIHSPTGGLDKWISYSVRIYDVSPSGERRCVSVKYHDDEYGIRLYNYSSTETTGEKKTYYDGKNIFACGIEGDRLLADGNRADCTVTFDLLNEDDYRGLCNYYIIAEYGNYTLKATPLKYTNGKINAVGQEESNNTLITLKGQANVTIDNCSAEYSKYYTIGTVVIENNGTGTLTLQNGAKVDGSRAIKNTGGGKVIVDGSEILARRGVAIENSGSGSIEIKNKSSVVSYDQNDSFIIVGDKAEIVISDSVIGNSGYKTKGIELTSGTLSITESTLYAATYGIYGGSEIGLTNVNIVMPSGTALQVDNLDLTIEGGSITAEKAVIGAKNLTLTGVTVTADDVTEAVIEASGEFVAKDKTKIQADSTELTFAEATLSDVTVTVCSVTVCSVTVNGNLTAENVTSTAKVYVENGKASVKNCTLGSLSVTNGTTEAEGLTASGVSVSGGTATFDNCALTATTTASGTAQDAIVATVNAEIIVTGGSVGGITLSDGAVLTVKAEASLGTVTANPSKITAENFTGSGKLFIEDGAHESVVVYGGSTDNWTIVSAGFNLSSQEGNVVLWRPTKFYNYLLTLEKLSSYQAYLTVKDVNPDDENDYVLLYMRGVSSDPMTVVEADRLKEDGSYADCSVTFTGNAGYVPKLDFCHGKYTVTANLEFSYCDPTYVFAVTEANTEVTFTKDSNLTAKITNMGTGKALIYVGSGAKAVIEGGNYSSTGKTIWVDGGTLIVNGGTVQGFGTSSSVNYGMAIYGGIGGESYIELNGGTFSANANLLWGDWEKNEYDEFWTIWGNKFQKNPIIGIARGKLIINGGTIQGGTDQSGKYQKGPGIYVGATNNYRAAWCDEAKKNAAAYVEVNGGTINTDLIISNCNSDESKIVGGEILYTVTAENKLTVSGGTIQSMYSAEPCVYFSGSPVVNELKVTPEGYVFAQDMTGGEISIKLAEASKAWQDGDAIVKGSADTDIFTIVPTIYGSGSASGTDIVRNSVVQVKFNLLVKSSRTYGYDLMYESDFFAVGAQATAPEKNAFGEVFVLKDDCKWYTDGNCTKEFDFNTAITADICNKNILYLYSHDWALNSPTVDVAAKEGKFFDTLSVGEDGSKTLSGNYNRSSVSLSENFVYNALTTEEEELVSVSLKVYKYGTESGTWTDGSPSSTIYSVADSGRYKAEVTFTVKDDTSKTASGECEFMLEVRPATLAVSESTPLTQTTTYKDKTVSQNPTLWVTGEITYKEDSYSMPKTESATRKYTYNGIEKDSLSFNFYNVGTYKIDFVIGGDNYVTLTGTLTYVINPIVIETVEWYSSYEFSITYGGTDMWSVWKDYGMAKAYAYKGSTRMFELDIAVKEGEFTHAGTYTLVASLPSDYKDSHVLSETAKTTHTATITQYNPTLNYNRTQKIVYSGNAVVPVVSGISGADDEKLDVIVKTSTVKTDNPTEDIYCDVITGTGYVYITFDAEKYPDYKPKTWTYEFSVTPAELTLTLNAMTREAGEQSDVDYSLTGFAEGESEEIIAGIRNGLIFKIKDSKGTFYDWKDLATLPAGEYTVSCDTTKRSDEDKARYSIRKTSTTAELTIEESIINGMPLPEAKQDLVYNGEEQTCVDEGKGYTLSGHINTNAGTYTATATPKKEKSSWSDGTTGEKTVTYTIAPISIKITVDDGLRSEKGNDLVSLTEEYTLSGTPVTSDGFTVTLTTNADKSVAAAYDITVTWSANNKNNYQVTVEGDKGAYLVYSLDDYYAFANNVDFMAAINYDASAVTASEVSKASDMVKAYNAMDVANKEQLTSEQRQKIEVLSQKLAEIAEAKTVAEQAIAALDGFGSDNIKEDGYQVCADKIAAVKAKVKQYADLSSGLATSDLSGYENIEKSEAVLASYGNSLAKANEALNALKEITAQGIKDGDYTREKAESLLNTAKKAVEEFVKSGGKTSEPTEYKQIARVETALADYDAYVTFTNNHDLSELPSPSEASLAELTAAHEAYTDYKSLSDGAKSLCGNVESALEALATKYSAATAAKTAAEQAIVVIKDFTAAKFRSGEISEEFAKEAINAARDKAKAYTDLSSGLKTDDLTGYADVAVAQKAAEDYSEYKTFVSTNSVILAKTPEQIRFADAETAVKLKNEFMSLTEDVKQVFSAEEVAKITALEGKAQRLTQKKSEAEAALSALADGTEQAKDKSALSALLRDAQAKTAEYVAENGETRELTRHSAIAEAEEKISLCEQEEINDGIAAIGGILTNEEIDKLPIEGLKSKAEEVAALIGEIDGASDKAKTALIEKRAALTELKARLQAKIELEDRKTVAVARLEAERENVLASYSFGRNAVQAINAYYDNAIRAITDADTAETLQASEDEGVRNMQSVEPLHVGWLVTDLLLAVALLAEIAYLVLRKVKQKRKSGVKTYSFVLPSVLLAATAVRASGWTAGVTCFVLLLLAVATLGIFVVDCVIKDKNKKSPFAKITDNAKKLARRVRTKIKSVKKSSAPPKNLD